MLLVGSMLEVDQLYVQGEESWRRTDLVRDMFLGPNMRLLYLLLSGRAI